ncbi:ribose-phosphate pyrophosphokinase [Candidatus Gottesmanbacteria bacterium]|nr:ribose-phosphate pyrophosphokinase [Candidatus Gottesmanbacteria bacterium]
MPISETIGRLAFHPSARDLHPGFFNFLEAELGPDVQIAVVNPDHFSDRTPRLDIPGIPSGAPLVVIPGFISGPHAEILLSALTKTGHALRFPHPTDSRSPWANQIHFLLTDLEGRGNKPTIQGNGNLVPYPELQYAYYLADALRDLGKADSVTLLDPHDVESVRALREGTGKTIEVTTITALREIANNMRQNNLLPDNSGVVIADNGAIGRAHFFAHTTEIPLVTRIVKERKNGKPVIAAVYGGEDIKGRTAILVDDMTATGGTIFTDAEELIKLGADAVIAVITHLKGVRGAREKIAYQLKQEGGGLKAIVATNSTPYYTQLDLLTGVHIVSVYPLMARAARAILIPTAENIAALNLDIFPIGTLKQYLETLYREYPGLALDYQPANDNYQDPTEQIFAT